MRCTFPARGSQPTQTTKRPLHDVNETYTLSQGKSRSRFRTIESTTSTRNTTMTDLTSHSETPDFELLDASKRSVPAFLRDDPWRVLRIQSDIVHGIEMMARSLDGCSRTVSVFGSTRVGEGDEPYELARKTCKLLGEQHFGVITGGGPGVMEAANRGAREAGALSIGLNIQLSREQHVNPYVDVSHTCHYFFVRKMMFAKYAHSFLIFPGGFGTLDELFESLTLIQTGKLANFPVVMMGTAYWQPLLDWLKNETLENGYIRPIDLERIKLLDEPAEAVAYLTSQISENGYVTSVESEQ